MLFRGLSAFWRRRDWPQLNRSQLSGFQTVCVSYGPHGDSTFISFLHPKAGKRELSIMRHAKAGAMRPIVKVSFLIHAVALLTTGSWELKKSQETMRSIVLCLWSFFSSFSAVPSWDLHNLPTTAIKSWKFLSPGCKNILFVSSPNCLYMWEGLEGSSDSDGCKSYFDEVTRDFSRWRHFSLNFFHYAVHFFLFKEKILWAPLLMFQVAIFNIP